MVTFAAAVSSFVAVAFAVVASNAAVVVVNLTVDLDI